MNNIKSIAVLDFNVEGRTPSNRINYGRMISDHTIEALMNPDRGLTQKRILFGTKTGKSMLEGSTTAVFNIITRNEMDRVIQELNFSTDVNIDESTAAEFGRLSGAQALVTGVVAIATDVTKTREKRTEKKKDGSKRDYYVNCVKNYVNVKVRWQAIDASTGQLLGSDNLEQAPSDNHCEKSFGSLKSIDALLEEAFRGHSENIANMLSPRYAKHEYQIRRPNKDTRYWEEAQKAADEAGDLNLDRSYAMFEELYKNNKYDPKLVENLAVLNEIVGNYYAAQTLYKKALSLDESNNGVREALQRLEKVTEYTEILAELGVEIRPYQWGDIDTREKVRIVANCDVMQQPDDQSEMIDRVPSGITLVSLGNEGSWAKIELPGDTTEKTTIGFIPNTCI